MNDWIMIVWIMLLPIFLGLAWGNTIYWSVRAILFIETHNPISFILRKCKERRDKKAHRCPTCGVLDNWNY